MQKNICKSKHWQKQTRKHSQIAMHAICCAKAQSKFYTLITLITLITYAHKHGLGYWENSGRHGDRQTRKPAQDRQTRKPTDKRDRQTRKPAQGATRKHPE
jgi:hypothetical protein